MTGLTALRPPLMQALAQVYTLHPGLPEIVGVTADTGITTARVLSAGDDLARILRWVEVLGRPYIRAARRTASTEIVINGELGGGQLAVLMLSPRAPEAFGVPADAAAAIVPAARLRCMTTTAEGCAV